MYACHRTHHQRQNCKHENGNYEIREDGGGGNNYEKDDRDYDQDRDKHHWGKYEEEVT